MSEQQYETVGHILHDGVMRVPPVQRPAGGEASRYAAEVEKDWEAVGAALIQLQQEVSDRLWKQAALLAKTEDEWGGGSVPVMAHEVGISVSWAYKLVKMWRVFGDDGFEDLSPSAHIVALEKTQTPEDARSWAREASENSWSKGRIARKIDGIENEDELGGENVVPIRRTSNRPRTCPTCKGSGQVSGEEYERHEGRS